MHGSRIEAPPRRFASFRNRGHPEIEAGRLIACRIRCGEVVQHLPRIEYRIRSAQFIFLGKKVSGISHMYEKICDLYIIGAIWLNDHLEVCI